MEPNRVIGGRPPLVNKNVTLLPKIMRAKLAQLRSGFCSKLNVSAGPTRNAVRNQPVSNHLFNCPAHPTSLIVTDVWEKPWDVANYLTSFADFGDLPDRVSRRHPFHSRVLGDAHHRNRRLRRIHLCLSLFSLFLPRQTSRHLEISHPSPISRK